MPARFNPPSPNIAGVGTLVDSGGTGSIRPALCSSGGEDDVVQPGATGAGARGRAAGVVQGREPSGIDLALMGFVPYMGFIIWMAQPMVCEGRRAAEARNRA